MTIPTGRLGTQLLHASLLCNLLSLPSIQFIHSFIHSFDDRFIWSFADDTTEVMLQGWLRNITISPPSLDVYQALTFPETKAVRATNAFDWQQALDSVILTRIHSGYECSTHRAISAIRLCLIISLMTTIGIAITTGSWIRIVD